MNEEKPTMHETQRPEDGPRDFPAQEEPVRRRVRLSFRHAAGAQGNIWLWLGVIFLLAVFMKANRGCNAQLESLSRVLTEEPAPVQSPPDAGAQDGAP